MSIEDLKTEKSEQSSLENTDKPQRGRPKGSGKKASVAPAAPVEPDIPPEVVAQLLDASLSQAVQLPCIHMGWKPLDEKETGIMIAGTKPLINKYLPDLLGQWAPEIMFLAMALSIYGTRFAAQRAEQNRQRQQQQRPPRPGGRSDGHGENIPLQTVGGESTPLAGGGSIM
jgi:hypothetical protein